jgi:hypothetical protein
MPTFFARAEYPASGTDYAVPFSYIDRTHVKVEVNGNPVAFSFLTGSTVRLGLTPSGGSLVVVRRETSPATRLVTFGSNTILDSATLNRANLQEFYLAQEAQDAVALIREDVDGIVVGAGNVPSPLSGQVGRFLRATGIGTYGWSTVGVADIPGAASISDVEAAEADAAADASVKAAAAQAAAIASAGLDATAKANAAVVTAAAYTDAQDGFVPATSLQVGAGGAASLLVPVPTGLFTLDFSTFEVRAGAACTLVFEASFDGGGSFPVTGSTNTFYGGDQAAARNTVNINGGSFQLPQGWANGPATGETWGTLRVNNRVGSAKHLVGTLGYSQAGLRGAGSFSGHHSTTAQAITHLRLRLTLAGDTLANGTRVSVYRSRDV